MRIHPYAFTAATLVFALTLTVMSLHIGSPSPPAPLPIDDAAHYSSLRNVPYCQAHPLQKYDLYLPKNATPATPLVVYIHGGGWSSGNKMNGIVTYYGNYFLEQSIAFASINYRLAPEYKYPTQNQDVACAMKSIAASLPVHNMDPGNIFLFGDSAGGLLASMYALTEKEPEIVIRGVISFYGTTDLVYQLNRTTHRNTNAQNYLGSNNEATARLASPLYQKIKQVPPFLFFHGESDTTVSISQAEKLYDKIRPIQPSSQFIRVANAGHHFDMNSRPSSAEIREIMLGFIIEHTSQRGSTDSVDESAILSLPPLDYTRDYELDTPMGLFLP